MRPWAVLLLVAVTLQLRSAPAWAQTELGVGVYAPEIPLNPYQWFSYAQALAQHLSKSLGVAVHGHAYKTAADFNRDRKAKRIQLAVLGGFHQAAGRAGRVLASARLAAVEHLKWSLMCKRRTSLAALRGQVLQLPSLGRLVNGLVQNGLLGGNINIKRHFRIVRSPSLTSAAEAVRLGQARAVFAPVNTGGLLPLLRRTIAVPPPAFVLLDARLPRGLADRAAAAMRGLGSTATMLVGWDPANAKQYTRFAVLARRRPLRMVMTSGSTPRFRHDDIIDARVLVLELPDASGLFEVP